MALRAKYLDLAKLEKRYAEMSDQELARISREDLAPDATSYYDREARRRGFPEPRPEAQRETIQQEAFLKEARERIAGSANLALRRIERQFAEMSDGDLDSISREDLGIGARPSYDREVLRRGIHSADSPGRGARAQASDFEAQAKTAEVPVPDPERILREAERRRVDRDKQLERLANSSPRSMQGPWNIIKTHQVAVTPADLRGDKLVVWLRRFHRRRPKGLRFDQLLISSCKGLGIPLTVQDSSFKSSFDEAMPRLEVPLFIWSCVLTAWLVGFIKPPVAVLLAIFVFPILIFLWAGRAGYHDLAPETAREETLGLIREIRERRGKHGDDSVLIVRCQDSFWRDIVQLSLRNASSAVIDVTEISENVIWELKTALREMAPESITLACGFGQYDEPQLPREVQETLAAELGADGPGRVQKFYYPRQAYQSDRLLRDSLMQELRARLAVAVAYSEYRRLFGISAPSQ
jgi:hypothetical protein